MRADMKKLAAAIGFCLVSSHAGAASLQVEPVLVEVAAPGAASTVTLRNEGATPITAQIRVYRWSQADGQEKLEPTDDVVASPPAATLAPGSKHVVRIVRVARGPAPREESYRLFVDQLPNVAQQRNGSVNLIVRHSIPVFFRAQDPGAASIAWSTEISKRNLIVTARNTGGRRLRIAALKVSDEKGSNVTFADGLVGYALAGSTMRWSTPLGGRSFGGGQVSVSAQGDTGPIHATAPLKAMR
jgi:fimbrial chaperone protein